ncbi:MAG: formylglycine-generating enzyme family protein [Bdellovibrionales bacterium]
MRFRILLIATFASMGIQTPAQANKLCTALLFGISKRADTLVGKPKLKVDGTEGLIAYLSALLEHQIIGETELLKLIDSLEKGEISNPIVEEQAWISSAAMIHREEIQEYIKGDEVDRKRLLEWSKKSLQEKERVRERREETRVETQDIRHKMKFNPIPAGRFRMGEDKHKVVVNLTNSIEVMSTQVTQKMWVEEMGDNPSEFVDGEHTIVVSVNGKSIKMQPDNPLENATFWSKLIFANKISEKYGLKPAYDFSGVKWKDGTRAEDGTLKLESGQVKINASNEDYYLAEGFRLPTEAEQEYIMSALGRAKSTYFYFVDTEADLEDYAWYSKNSDEKTHPVGTTAKSLIINGHEFHDVLGNVFEQGYDSWDSDKWQWLPGGTNPLGKEGLVRIMRSGGWNSGPWVLTDRVDVMPNDRIRFLGFRLVRTLR